MATKKKAKSKSKKSNYDPISGQLRVPSHMDDDLLMNHFVGKKYDNILSLKKTLGKRTGSSKAVTKRMK
jgi:hypothetical protein